jgi:glycosyltransferase involved in cell wall biosynthesis
LQRSSEPTLLIYIESPFVSGAEAQVLRNVTSLLQEGVKIVVVSSLGIGDIKSKFGGAISQKLSKVIQYKLIFADARSPLTRVIADQLRYAAGFARGVKFAKKYRPTVVHVNNGGFPGAAGARGFASGAKHGFSETTLVMTVNNLAVDYASPARKLDYWFDRLLVSRVDAWVTGSKAASGALSKVIPINLENCLVIPNGIPVPTCLHPESCNEEDSLSHFEGLKVGLLVGLLEKRKGHSHFLRALEILQLNKALPGGWVFLIDGEGPERELLEDQITSLGLSSRVRLIGSSPCVFHLMKRCDLFVHPSVSNEDLPNVITEAMALGKPIIGSRLAGIPEQIEDGVTGLLFEPGSDEQLASRMQLLIQDEKMREAFGISAVAKYQREFLPGVALESYKKLYGLDSSVEH